MTSLRHAFLSYLLAFSLLIVAGCAPDPPVIQVPSSLKNTFNFINSIEFKQSAKIDASHALDSLVNHLSIRSEPGTALNSVSPYTLFAPTNKAFVDFISLLNRGDIGFTFAQSMNQLNRDMRTRLLSYHVLQGTYNRPRLGAGADLLTIIDESILVTKQNTLQGATKVPFNVTAQIVSYDRDTYNGTVHLVDKILIPPSLERDIANAVNRIAAPILFGAQFSTTAALIEKADADPTVVDDPSKIQDMKVASILERTATQLEAYNNTLPNASSTANIRKLGGAEWGLTFFAIPDQVIEQKLGGRDAFLESFTPKEARAFLLHHLALGKYPADQLTQGKVLLTFAGGLTASSSASTYIAVSAQQKLANNRSAVEKASIVEKDRYTPPNGIVHVVDGPLWSN